MFMSHELNTGWPWGFNFVKFSVHVATNKWIRFMGQQELDGRTICVNNNRPRTKGESGGGGDFGFGGAGGGFNASGLSDVNMYIGNMSFDTNEDGLQELLEKFGPVLECFVPTDRENGLT